METDGGFETNWKMKNDDLDVKEDKIEVEGNEDTPPSEAITMDVPLIINNSHNVDTLEKHPIDNNYNYENNKVIEGRKNGQQLAQDKLKLIGLQKGVVNESESKGKTFLFKKFRLTKTKNYSK
jgi:hypothetical protein